MPLELSVAVKVLEEVTAGRQRVYQDRPDLHFALRGLASLSKVKKAAREKIATINPPMTFVSGSFRGERELRVIIRRETSAPSVTVAQMQGAVPAAPLTSSGRRRAR
jgi:hypothetical protein